MVARAVTLHLATNNLTSLFISGAKTSSRKIQHAVTAKRGEDEDTYFVQMHLKRSVGGDLRAWLMQKKKKKKWRGGRGQTWPLKEASKDQTLVFQSIIFITFMLLSDKEEACAADKHFWQKRIIAGKNRLMCCNFFTIRQVWKNERHISCFGSANEFYRICINGCPCGEKAF